MRWSRRRREKRLAARANLQRPSENQIQTPARLFEWATSSIPGIQCAFVSSETVHEKEKILQQR